MHWSFDFVRSPFQQQQGFATAMNTVNDISYCPSAEEKTRNAEQIVVTGRRNWKLMKGKKEAVWPPNL
jgi:transcriptional enhancer factor